MEEDEDEGTKSSAESEESKEDPADKDLPEDERLWKR